jgi:pyruvate/2-oxoglutarate dehydrogenase complex dihydrolipoamide dehydrogenase (E3) component
MKHEYDMIVIGAGAAGLTAAGMSALLGAKTALIEESRLGGDCTWTGCIPSKTLLKAARVAQQMRKANRFGLYAIKPEISFQRIMEHVRAVREQVYEDADAPENMERLGMEVILGRAEFADPHTILVQAANSPAKRMTSRFFVVATGSRPRKPPFQAPCLSNESLFEINSLPERFLVIGAGPAGVEMAQAFGRLGSAVTIVAPGPGILPRDDKEHAHVVESCLAEEGISFRLGRRVKDLDRRNGSLLATLDDGQTIACDAAFAAIGREPAIDNLRLHRAGVAFSPRGIQVDQHCRTSQKNIWAAGDVTGEYLFTHVAEHMSKVAVINAILHWPAKIDRGRATWCTFCEPELAQVGESEACLTGRGEAHVVYRFPFRKLDRAITEGEQVGEIKVMATKRGRILGASIVGANAGEMISEYALAIRHGLSLSQISATIHPYPTYMLGNRRAADQAAIRQLDSPWLGLLGRLLGLRGVRKGSAAL